MTAVAKQFEVSSDDVTNSRKTSAQRLSGHRQNHPDVWGPG
jgi:hypothetical protein